MEAITWTSLCNACQRAAPSAFTAQRRAAAQEQERAIPRPADWRVCRQNSISFFAPLPVQPPAVLCPCPKSLVGKR
jgi:hypothetical protein